MLSRREAAEKLGVSLPTFDRICKAQRIPVVRIGRSVKVSEEKLEAWVDSQLKEEYREQCN